MKETSSIPTCQELPWGTLEWLQTPLPLNPTGMSVALVALEPGKQVEPHLHVGEEQVLLVLSGQAEHRVDGKAATLVPGVLSFIPSGSTHEMVNRGDEVCRFFTISSPGDARGRLRNATPAVSPSDADEQTELILPDMISPTTGHPIVDHVAEAAGMTVTLHDPAGTVLARSSNYPRFCDILREQPHHAATCHQGLAVNGYQASRTDSPVLLKCPNQLAALSAPIMLRGRFLGTVTCGNVLLTKPRSMCLYGCDGHPLGPVEADMVISHFREIPLVMLNRLRAALESARVMVQSMVDANYITRLEDVERRSLEQRLFKSRADVRAVDSEPRDCGDRINPPQEGIVAAARQVILQNYREYLTLARVAATVHVSPYYLSHLFRRSTGESFGRFLRRVRMQEAARLLRETSLQVAKIARLTGHREASYFSQAFKEYAGVTPNEFRRGPRRTIGSEGQAQ